MTNDKVYYIAGPMSGYPDYNYPLFHEVAAWLREWKGYTVINPAENFLGDQSRKPWEYAEAATQQVIYAATDAVMLPGWESSPGARTEFALTRWLKKPVWEAVRASRWSCGWTLRECESWLVVENEERLAIEREAFDKDNRICIDFTRIPQSAPGVPPYGTEQGWINALNRGDLDDLLVQKVLRENRVYVDFTMGNTGIGNALSLNVKPVVAQGGNPRSILDDALAAVRGSRRENYGHPYDNHALIGKFWGLVLGTDPVPADKVALCMIGLKIAREVNSPLRDNAVDIAGYADCLNVINERMKEDAA